MLFREVQFLVFVWLICLPKVHDVSGGVHQQQLKLGIIHRLSALRQFLLVLVQYVNKNKIDVPDWISNDGHKPVDVG
jgi:hypothetical protein